MTRRRVTRRAEVRDLRDRAVADAAEIERLRDLVERWRCKAWEASADCDYWRGAYHRVIGHGGDR